MIEISSNITGKKFDLYKLEQILKPMGYTIGGNWDYDHGSFDYKIDVDNGYHFLRVPFKAIDGQLDSRNCTVELQTPFMLTHQYEEDLDHDHSDIGNLTGMINQFQEPEKKDAEVPEEQVEQGKTLIKELESALT